MTLLEFFIAPLFGLGLLSLSLPIIFHLIRRTPRGRYSFSSLMFLSPSPPRLTRRSRLDNLLLLLLRALALLLLVIAFMRPFWRMAANLSLSGIRGRNVAILVDTSASMRRGNAWEQAVAKVDETLSDLEPVDDVALFTFDRRVKAIVDFDQESRLRQDSKVTLVKQKLAKLSPSWSETDFGSALLTVADALDIANDKRQSDAVLQIVAISDLQQGSQIESLQAYDWPEAVRVSVHKIAPGDTSNGSLHLLVSEEGVEEETEPRVRIRNASDSLTDQFYVTWADEHKQFDDEPVAVYVPPGQSRVVRVPRSDASLAADRLALEGDTCDFDNEFFVVPVRQNSVPIVYIGSDSAGNDAGLLHYMELALAETPRRRIDITTRDGKMPLELLAGELPKMIVVTEAVAAEQLRELEQYADQGGTLMIVPKNDEAAVSLVSFVDYVEDQPSVKQADYVMLGEIDFSHPLFAAFSSPQYSDFTKVHFWQHRQIAVKDNASARVVARFDNTQPALWEQPFGDGKVFVLASGWHPEDSQLARSTKFVPLLAGILEQAGAGENRMPNYSVGQPVSFAAADSAALQTTFIKPDGTQFELQSGTDRFAETDQPGIYSIRSGDDELNFAVNVASSESDTAAMNVEQLEQHGVLLGTHSSQSDEYDRQRQLRDIELESSQKIWRWLIFSALGVLIFETWLAGKKPRETNDGPTS